MRRFIFCLTATLAFMSVSFVWRSEDMPECLRLLASGGGVIRANADVAITEANFPDDTFRAYVSSNFDTDEDGVLSDGEIEAVTIVGVGGSNISSLKGIEYFTALTILVCYNNQLTALDVSKNTALTYMYCGNNQLTALDVSNNTALYDLSCTGNQLTALDVSNNTALTILSCFANQLTALDVSNNTALTRLDCEQNRLTVLDLSKNTALTALQCAYNQLTELDLSNNTALTALYCYRNQLTALDVSKNIALENLDCGVNQLTALDLSNNTALTYLDSSFQIVDGLQITSSGNSSYPYQLSFSDYMSPDKFPNISDVKGITSGYMEISTIYSEGIAQFASKPAKVTYNYATGYGTQSMDVTIYWPSVIERLIDAGYISSSNAILDAGFDGGKPSFTSADGVYTASVKLNFDVDASSWRISVNDNGYITASSDSAIGSITRNTARQATITLNQQAIISGLHSVTLYARPKFNNAAADSEVYSSLGTIRGKDEEKGTKPEIITDSLTNAITNQSYSLQLKASGSTPITWTHTGKLPAGLSLSESGLISGTPTKAGKSSFTVTAQNSYGKISKSFTIQTLDPVSITTASLKAGTIGKSYSVTMRAKGSKTITWSASGLPNGLMINAKGKISGKPTAYGVFNVKVKAENGAGITEKTLQLTVKPIAPKLSGSFAKPTLNQPYSSSLKVTGSTPITWSIEGNLPEGLTLDSSTGIISGTPTSYAKSGYKFTLTATNDAGRKSKNITLKVNGKAPKITAKLPGAAAGENYSAEITATGSEPITFTADLPEFLTLDGSTISGTVPDSIKSFKIKIYASNPVKQNVKKSYTIKVSAKKSLAQNLNAHNDTNITEVSKGVDSEVIVNVPDPTENIVRLYSESYVIVAELGEVSADKDGMHDFDVEIPDCIPEGSELVYISNSDEPSSDDEIAEFFDEDGNEISKVPESRKISVSIWLNPERIYKPVIAVKK